MAHWTLKDPWARENTVARKSHSYLNALHTRNEFANEALDIKKGEDELNYASNKDAAFQKFEETYIKPLIGSESFGKIADSLGTKFSNAAERDRIIDILNTAPNIGDTLRNLIANRHMTYDEIIRAFTNMNRNEITDLADAFAQGVPRFQDVIPYFERNKRGENDINKFRANIRLLDEQFVGFNNLYNPPQPGRVPQQPQPQQPQYAQMPPPPPPPMPPRQPAVYIPPAPPIPQRQPQQPQIHPGVINIGNLVNQPGALDHGRLQQLPNRVQPLPITYNELRNEMTEANTQAMLDRLKGFHDTNPTYPQVNDLAKIINDMVNAKDHDERTQIVQAALRKQYIRRILFTGGSVDSSDEEPDKDNNIKFLLSAWKTGDRSTGMKRLISKWVKKNKDELTKDALKMFDIILAS